MAKWIGAVVLTVVGVLVWRLELEGADVSATRASASAPVERAVAELKVEPPRTVAERPSAQTPNRVAVQAPPADNTPVAAAEELEVRTADFVIVDGLTQLPLAGVELIELDADRLTKRLGRIDANLGDPKATSDASGVLQYSYAVRTYAACLLRRSGYAELFLSSSLLGDNGSEYAIEMWPAQRFTVRVTDAAGAAVVGAAVFVTADTDELAPGDNMSAWGFGLRDEWDGRFRHAADALTNAYGETTVLGFNERVSVRIEVQVAGQLAYSGKDLQVVNERVEIRLPASSTIEGVLRDSLGAPLADVNLYLGAYDNVMPVVMSTKTDASGRFEFAAVPMGEDGELLDWLRGKDYGMLTVLSNGELLHNVQLDWKAAVDDVLQLELQTEASFSISGAIYQASGALVTTDGFVWVQRDGSHITGVPSEGGQFYVPGLARGEYALTFRADGGPHGHEVFALAGDTDVRLEALASGHLALHLVPAPGSPPGTKVGSNVMVYGWLDQGSTPMRSGRMFEPQSFELEQVVEFPGCAPGSYRFVVRGLSGMVGYADIEVLAGTENVATIPMQPEARVEVVLPADVDGEVSFLVAGRQVGWQDASDEPAIVPAGVVTVRWVRADGTPLETTVVAVAGETVTAHFD